MEETGSGATFQLVPNGHKVVRTSDLHRIRNAHAALAEGLKAESEALVDLDQVTIAFERQRQAGYGCSHAYLLTEMMALCPSIGSEKLAELLALANLTSLYSMFSIDGPPDDVLASTLAKAATAMTPSASTITAAPLRVHALTLDRLTQLLRHVPVVFVCNDHGHSGNADHLETQFAGWHTGQGRPILVTIDNAVVGKTGADTAAHVHDHVKSHGAGGRACISRCARGRARSS